MRLTEGDCEKKSQWTTGNPWAATLLIPLGPPQDPQREAIRAPLTSEPPTADLPPVPRRRRTSSRSRRLIPPKLVRGSRPVRNNCGPVLAATATLDSTPPVFTQPQVVPGSLVERVVPDRATRRGCPHIDFSLLPPRSAGPWGTIPPPECHP